MAAFGRFPPLATGSFWPEKDAHSSSTFASNESAISMLTSRLARRAKPLHSAASFIRAVA